MSTRLRIGCFASGRGSNFEALLKRIQGGDLSADIAFLITNNSGAGAVDVARKAAIPVFHISTKTVPNSADMERKMVQRVVDSKVDLLVLCGYMKSLPTAVMTTPRYGAINIHPSLLPKFGGAGFYGERVHRAVLEAKETESGVTVHRVEPIYDSGEILEQRRVAVMAGDTVEQLAARVLEQEHDLYWRVVQRFATGELGAPKPSFR